MAQEKGAATEEILRAFFLRRGFFAVRSIPLSFRNHELTDVDIWLCGRSAGGSRRVLVCDVKDKQRPKAVERILWTKGLVSFLNADGAYVATTDKRQNLRELADRLGVQLIDGNDIRRIKADKSIVYPERLSDEELIGQLNAADESRRSTELKELREAILGALAEGFGTRSACRALELFASAAASAVSYHPNSDSARAAGRLTYFAAAVVSVSLDYVSKETVVQTAEERRRRILDTVRFGRLRDDVGQRALDMALLLVSKYAPGGKTAAKAVELKLEGELAQIPAEIVADQAARLLNQGDLFGVARDLEMSTYRREVPTFDCMQTSTRALLGAFLDYAGIERERFSQAWTNSAPNGHTGSSQARELRQPELFGDGKPSD